MNNEIGLRFFFLLLISTCVNVNCKLEVKRILPRTGYAASGSGSTSVSDYGPSSWYGKYFGGSESANSWKGVTPNKWGVNDATSASTTSGTSWKSPSSGYGSTPNKWELLQLKQQQSEIPIDTDVKASLAFLPTILLTPKNPDATVVVGGSVSQRWGTESAQKYRGRWDKMTPKRGRVGGGGGGGVGGLGEQELPERLPEPPINEGWGAAGGIGGGGKGGALGGLKGGGLKGGIGGGFEQPFLKGGIKGGIKGGGGGGWGQQPIEPPIQDGWGAEGGKGGYKGGGRVKGKGKGKGGWGQSAANQALCGGHGGVGGTDLGAAEGPLGDYGDYGDYGEYDYGGLPPVGDYDYDPGLDGGRRSDILKKRRLRQRALCPGGKGVNGVGGKGGGKGGQGLGNKGGLQDGGGGGTGWGNGDKGGDGIGSFWDNPWNLWNVLKFKKRRFGRRPQNDHGHGPGPPGGPEGEFGDGGGDLGRPGFFGSLGSWLPMVLMGLLFIAEVSLSFGDPFLIPVLAIPLAILVLLRMIYDGSGFGMVALD